jgi:4-alpha-glucanotransferase
VRAALAEAGILSYRVLWFERHPDGTFKRPGEYPVEAAATTSTHDLPTLAGFFGSHDIKARRAAGLIDEAAYVQQMKARASEIEQLKKALAEAGFPGDPLGFLLSTPSKLAIINEEDMTGEAEQQNLPGSTWQRPNWRRKMRITIEESRSLTAAVTRCLREAGR